MKPLFLALTLGLGIAAAPGWAAPPTAAILAEGLSLYQSERSSWVATDLLMASTIDPAQIGGYLSYFRGDSVCTIFWGAGATGAAGSPLLASYTFPRQDVRVATGNRHSVGAFTPQEAQLFSIRQATMAVINSADGGFNLPANTSLNVALLADKNETRAYVLTGPRQNGIVPIGNDYLLTFSPAGKLRHTERLHNSYLPMSWDASKGEVTSMMHSHLEAHPYITPTDICSILLYKDQIAARQHCVFGKEYVSIFDIDKQQLAIITRAAFEKMATKK